MENLFGIISKVQKNHNELGSVYIQLAKSLIKLQQIHDFQLAKIEELEIQNIEGKVKIEVFKRNELEKLSNIFPETSKPLQEKNEIFREPTAVTPKRNLDQTRSIIPPTFQSLQSIKKKRPDSSVKSKITKTQSKLHSFILKKEISQKAEETSQQKKPLVDSRIIIDADGFQLLDYKKLKQV